jgi:branched-subunit amino acid ABC-type transport system permease component
MAGAGGWLYAHYITYMSPQSLDTHASISALLMAVVGGAGYILGPVLALFAEPAAASCSLRRRRRGCSMAERWS